MMEGGGEEGLLERVGVRMFRVALGLLPRPLRREWGDELVAHFRERQARVLRRRGRPALFLFWIREAGGLVRAASRQRRPDAWSRRTAHLAPDSSSTSDPARPRDHALSSPKPPARTSTPTGSMLMEQLTSDLRFATRTFMRRPGLTLLAVVSLALGIGASTAMFSVVDSVLLAPLPYEDPEELVHVYRADEEYIDHPTLSGIALRGVFSPPEFFWLAENQRVFEHLGGFFAWGGLTLTGEGPAEELELVRATPGLLPALEVEALRGRRFGPEDDPRDGARSIMLTERYWNERFGGDPELLGSTLRLDDEPYTVIGILPPRVDVATDEADAWILATGSSSDSNWGNHSMTRVVGRLGDGVTLEQAESEMIRIMEAVPEDNHHGHSARVYPAHDDSIRRVKTPLTVLIVGAFLLLAVGCGNVAALLLGLGIDREQEIAVRGALGAGRTRLGRQLLTESLLLAGVGALAGIGLAWGIGEALLFLAPPELPRVDEATLDGRVLAFAVAVSGLAGVLFGLVPALGLSRPDLGATINSSRGSTAGKSRIQAAVVVGELALATVLLVSAALLGRTLFALNTADPGLEAEGLYAIRVSPPYQRFSDDDPQAQTAAIDGYFQEIVDEVASVPGVESVAVTNNIPLTGDRNNNNVYPEGWDAEAEGEDLVSERRLVSDGYFETIGVDMVEGRTFEPADNRADAAPVMILSEGLARRVWPDEPAVGKQVSFWGRDPSTVVGVARNLRDESLDRATRYAFYVPARQLGAQAGSLLLRARSGDPGVLEAARQRIHQLDPDIAITRMVSFDDLVSDAVTGERYRARLMVTFALLAAVFAMMGVYGVVARSVARRTREMGIRIALGARRGDVHQLVLVKGFRLALFGAVLGVAASAWATRFLEDLLYGVDAVDWVTMLAIATLVGAASLAAAYPPARRATRVDPAGALREE